MEVTLKNDNQPVPWQFVFILNQKENTFTFTYTNQFYGFNVSQHLQSLKFFDSMTKDGETTLFDGETGLKIFKSDKNKFEVKENFNGWLELLEVLLFIQEKIPVLLNLNEELKDQNINHIFEVADIIRNGKSTVNVSPFNIVLTIENASDTIEKFKGENNNPLLFSYKDGWKTKILGNEIDLGVAVVSFDAFIEKKDFEKLKKAVKAKENEIEVTFTPKENTAIVDFLKWDCIDRHTRIQIVDS